jgi:hypothetical protein
MSDTESYIITDPIMVAQVARIYAEGKSEPTDDYEYVTCEFFDEWRWGMVMLLTLRDRDGKLWGTLVREAADGSGTDWDHFDEATSVVLETVIAVPKVDYVLARMVK